MSYTSYETSAHDGAPIEGFYFIGTQKSYRYTNAQRDTNINGLPYTAVKGIHRGGIAGGTQEDDNLELEITMPIGLDLVTDYAFATSPPDLSVAIYRYHEDSSSALDWAIIWSGKVTNITLKGKIATFQVPSLLSLVLAGSVPDRFYQNQCNHVLYDQRCQVNKALFTQNTTISVAPSGTTINVVNDGFADNVLNAGEIFIPARGERRGIVSNIANVLTITFPFFNAALGDAVQLFAGCNHAYLGDCDTKFANTIHYGGFPYVPKENPFAGDL